jgi:hypothetical protein
MVPAAPQPWPPQACSVLPAAVAVQRTYGFLVFHARCGRNAKKRIGTALAKPLTARARAYLSHSRGSNTYTPSTLEWPAHAPERVAASVGRADRDRDQDRSRV